MVEIESKSPQTGEPKCPKNEDLGAEIRMKAESLMRGTFSVQDSVRDYIEWANEKIRAEVSARKKTEARVRDLEDRFAAGEKAAKEAIVKFKENGFDVMFSSDVRVQERDKQIEGLQARITVLADAVKTVEGLLEFWYEDKIDLEDLLGRLDDAIHNAKVKKALSGGD